MTGAADRLDGFPIEDPSSDLPRTARRILAAASRLLAERGYEAITLENVAAEAGVNKASIRYNFGNKAGLVTAVLDSVIRDEFHRAMDDLPAVAIEDRVHALLEGKRRLIEASDDFRELFDILPHVLRDDAMRARLWTSYPWWHELNLRLLGLEGDDADQRPDALRGLGPLISAIVDGLSIQAALGTTAFDISEPLLTLEFLLSSAMPQLRAMAGATEAEPA
jgi:AcrR family transcriptional regulator